MNMNKYPKQIVEGQSSRVRDTWGSGQYQAPRGSRKHDGLDIKATSGQRVFAPFPGVITRVARPYANDPRYTGIVLEGSGEWTGYSLKIFYLEGLVSGGVDAGQLIGYAQDLGWKYTNITNHIHVEAYDTFGRINPSDIWMSCF